MSVPISVLNVEAETEACISISMLAVLCSETQSGRTASKSVPAAGLLGIVDNHAEGLLPSAEAIVLIKTWEQA